jgi:hypothetical protein
LRIARPVRDLERSAAMYAQGLGLEVIGSFELFFRPPSDPQRES